MLSQEMSSDSDQTEKQMNSWAKPILSCKISVNKKKQKAAGRTVKILRQNCSSAFNGISKSLVTTLAFFRSYVQ